MKKLILAVLLILFATLFVSAHRKTDCVTTSQTELIGTCLRRTYEMCCNGSDGQIYCISWTENIAGVCPID